MVLQSAPALRPLRIFGGCTLHPIGGAVDARACALRTYRRPPSPTARAQIKWVTSGLSVGAVGQLLATVSTAAFGSVPCALRDSSHVAVGTSLGRNHAGGAPLPPFRHRSVIWRTVVYGVLTAVVTGLYAASVTVVQRLTITATGSSRIL
jgi:hypothetical protein